jgi:hypothetical protein
MATRCSRRSRDFSPGATGRSRAGSSSRNSRRPGRFRLPPYRDRVVHHLLYELLEPRFERRFIADSLACRRGKGTRATALRLQHHSWRASRHGKVRAWALQMDIQSFFCPIHRPTLLGFLSKGFPTEELQPPGPSLWRLLETVARYDASRTAVRRCPAETLCASRQRNGWAREDQNTGCPSKTSQASSGRRLSGRPRAVRETPRCEALCPVCRRLRIGPPRSRGPQVEGEGEPVIPVKPAPPRSPSCARNI